MVLSEQQNEDDSVKRLFERFVRATLDQMSIWAATEGIPQSVHQFVRFTENSYTIHYEGKQDYWNMLLRYRDHPFWSQKAEVFVQFARKLQQTLLKGNVPAPVSEETVIEGLYEVLLCPVLDILERYDTFQPTQEQILECYSRYYEAWTATSIQWEVTMPLTDFRSDLQRPVQINSHFQLAPFSPEEQTFVWNQCIRLDDNLFKLGPVDRHEFSHATSKLIGSQITKRQEFGGKELHAEIENLITALRLVKTGDVGILAYFGTSQMPRYLMTTPSLRESSFIVYAGDEYFRRPGNVYFLQYGSYYTFSEADVPVAQIIAEALEKLDQQKSGLAIALRRFNQSYSRLTLEDRIIDLTIALESCLLADVSKEELTYRLALRGAALLAEANIWIPENAQALLKAMYAIRSAIVHSGQQLSNLGREQKKLLHKLEIDPKEFPQRCEEIVRNILRTYVIRLTKKGGSVQTICGDLDRYILQGLARVSREEGGDDL